MAHDGATDPGIGSTRELARLISRVERGGSEADAVMQRLGARPQRGWVIGVTGLPGSGKSTLVDRLTALARAEQRTVGVVAVDPSSPYTGGAILGDRVRMLRHSGDGGVFIRSMAARDSLGGLAPATRDVARLLDAFGFDVIMLETVGVGQGELDVVKVADTVMVVTVPGLGDSIQTLKAGILEIADVFVVNMADRPGADRTVADLRAMIAMGPKRAWTPPILETVAVREEGIGELWATLVRHHAHTAETGELAARRRQRAETEVFELLDRKLRGRVRRRVHEAPELAGVLAAARAGELDPHSAAARIIAVEFEDERPPPRPAARGRGSVD